MLDHLEDNIRRVIADIRPQMLEKGIENWTSRLDYVRASRGSPMPEVIFKILGHNATETFAKLQQPYGDSVLSRAQVFRWFKAFSKGRELIEDEPRRAEGPQFQKPLKMSLEFGILCVQIVA
ncbi:hypothetical protein TNCV_3016881 [Trichonephila clavipes]|nr:hypothetical protein TNCV_3016881 [Trichonephila clavipes]